MSLRASVIESSEQKLPNIPIRLQTHERVLYRVKVIEGEYEAHYLLGFLEENGVTPEDLRDEIVSVFRLYQESMPEGTPAATSDQFIPFISGGYMEVGSKSGDMNVYVISLQYDSSRISALWFTNRMLLRAESKFFTVEEEA